jgi:hypothetical protein
MFTVRFLKGERLAPVEHTGLTVREAMSLITTYVPVNIRDRATFKINKTRITKTNRTYILVVPS